MLERRCGARRASQTTKVIAARSDQIADLRGILRVMSFPVLDSAYLGRNREESTMKGKPEPMKTDEAVKVSDDEKREHVSKLWRGSTPRC